VSRHGAIPGAEGADVGFVFQQFNSVGRLTGMTNEFMSSCS